MDNKAKLLRRLIAMVGVLMLLAGISAAGLFSLQVVNGEEYREQATNRLTSSMPVAASRGEIVDRYGRALVTNQSVYSLRIDYSYWDKTNQNANILSLVGLIRESGSEEVDSLPISRQEPFTYTSDAESKEWKAFLDFLDGKKVDGKEIDPNLPAPDMIQALRKYYKVDDALSDGNGRIIVGIRYEMQRHEFSTYNSFIIASDVSIDLITQIKERHHEFAGVNVETESIRKYGTTYAAHILGRVGPMYKEDWEGEDGKGGYNKKEGYQMNDEVGKQGAEYSFEKYLHGVSGTRSIETDITGTVTNVAEGKKPQPGNNCILTIDLDLQKALEDSLARELSKNPDAKGGAAVAIDVNSGQVLAMGSYPTFDLTQWNEMYDVWKNDKEGTPLYNRATLGSYAPGSTYKPLTAIAGLEEGLITGETLIDCQHYYTRFEQSRTYTCMGRHGPSNVLRAIQKSCNVFFYELGHQLGGEKLEEWEHLFGFGEKTGIELSENPGSASGPANRKRMLESLPTLNSWQEPGGDVITTAIGQCDNAFTPLQLANYTATIANGGTLYRPTILRSVKTYDYTGTVKAEKPDIIRQIDISDQTLALVREGMAEVTDDQGTAAATFANYPIKVAGKSGTAQTGGQKDNAVFIAYAPFEDPQIAVAVVGEKAGHGSSIAPIARDIFDAYFAKDNSANVGTVPRENMLLK